MEFDLKLPPVEPKFGRDGPSKSGSGERLPGSWRHDDGRPGIMRVSHKHNEIMDYMLANPLAPLSQVASAFDVTQPWLSCIIHSDAFQAMLKEKQAEMFSVGVLSIAEKAKAVASKALDNVLEKLHAAEADGEFALATADKMMHRLGYAPTKVAPSAPGPGGIQNNYYIDRDSLASARALMDSRTYEGEKVIEPKETDKSSSE